MIELVRLLTRHIAKAGLVFQMQDVKDVLQRIKLDFLTREPRDCQVEIHIGNQLLMRQIAVQCFKIDLMHRLQCGLSGIVQPGNRIFQHRQFENAAEFIEALQFIEFQRLNEIALVGFAPHQALKLKEFQRLNHRGDTHPHLHRKILERNLLAGDDFIVKQHLPYPHKSFVGQISCLFGFVWISFCHAADIAVFPPCFNIPSDPSASYLDRKSLLSRRAGLLRSGHSLAQVLELPNRLQNSEKPMPALPKILAHADELTAIRRDLHANPELGFEEHRTSGIVQRLLAEYGVDQITAGLGGTGVVGLIKGKTEGSRRVGLRADMDALPIHETTNLPYASKNPGVMHACGHDSHTTMLLGAARYLAETRDFSGTAVLIFQPAEEGLGGARKMLSEGLFDQFPCDEIFGMHNNPNGKPGLFKIKPGKAMAGACFFDIKVHGIGSHAAMPDDGRDSIVIASALVGELQTIVSRNVPPAKPAVLSVTTFHAGNAYNVCPTTATLSGTIRYFHDEVRTLIETRMQEICAGMARMHGIEIEVDIRNIFDVLENDGDLSNAYLAAASEIVGPENTLISQDLVMGSEDFSDMLKRVPGAYCTLGHGGTVPVHNPAYVFDDAVLPVGASILARIVERRLQIG